MSCTYSFIRNIEDMIYFFQSPNINLIKKPYLQGDGYGQSYETTINSITSYYPKQCREKYQKISNKLEAKC